MTGPDRYTDAFALLRDAREAGLTVSDRLALLAEAQVHATLAAAAASALAVTLPLVGDSCEVTDWARLVQPTALAAGRTRVSEPLLPKYWPPQHGDIWRDRLGDEWLCQTDGLFARITADAPVEDFPDAVRFECGPMALFRPSPLRNEVPF
jgi:hypothetical protein